MIRSAKALLLVVTLAGACLAQTQNPQNSADPKAGVYYHFAMGRLLAEMGQSDGSRSEVNRAIQHYEEALKLDPSADVIFEELGDLYIATNRLQDAQNEAEELLKQNPNNIGARKMLARIYTRAVGNGQNGFNEDALKKAVDQYQKITQQAPKDADSWVMLGRLNTVLHNTPEAEKAFNKALESEPDNEDALVGLAELYGQLGDAKRAAEKLKTVTDKNPSPKALLALAEAYKDMNDYKDAADAFRRALEAGAEDERIPAELAEALLNSNQYDEALKIYLDLAANQPRVFEYQLEISEIYLLKHDIPNARAALDKAKSIAPANNLNVRFQEVGVLEAEGNTDKAISTMKGILEDTAKKTYSENEAKTRVRFLSRLAFLYRNNDQNQLAAETFRQIPAIDPSAAVEATVQVIECYRAAHDQAAAMREADAALKKYPKERMIAEERSAVLADAGKYNEAISELQGLAKAKADYSVEISLAQTYQRAKRWNDMATALDEAEKLADTKEHKRDVYFMRGAGLERQKKYAESEAAFRKALEIDPDYASALNYLGYMLADRNERLDEASQMINKALSLEPDNGAYMDSLAWVYYRQGRLADAEGLLVRALQKMKDPTVHDHLGDVYAKQGKTREAVAQWEAAVKEYQSGNKEDTDAEEMAKVAKKLQSAEAQLAQQHPK
jgi:tetratricopeptide (TPR) repeat protein